MRYFLSLLLVLFCFASRSQTLENNVLEIADAEESLSDEIALFKTSLSYMDLDSAVERLIKSADNVFKKLIVSKELYWIENERFGQLIKEVYLEKPNSSLVSWFYAIFLHSKGDYAEAALVYEKCLASDPEEVVLNLWLADCYMSLGRYEKSLAYWKKFGPSTNTKIIDKSLFYIHGSHNQVKLRNTYRAEIFKGNSQYFYDLFYLDMNWEIQWAKYQVNAPFLLEDSKLLEAKLLSNSLDYKMLKAYIEIKKLSTSVDKGKEIAAILRNYGVVDESNPLPQSGAITADLLKICFQHKALSEEKFFKQRGDELLALAKSKKDVHFLNAYASLQKTVNGKVDASISLMGWKDFKDERFAEEYIKGKTGELTSEDADLAQAILDFPTCSALYALKYNCVKKESKDQREVLIELIKREFKTLGSNDSRYGYSLYSYLYFLQNLK